MNLHSVSCQVKKRHPGLFEEEISIEQIRRQRLLSSRFLSSFTPKHYPRIFLDQRLKSIFGKKLRF